jgi:hypothetical protein
MTSDKIPSDQAKTTDRVPAEAFHPSVFIIEEMEARGWGRWELARRMGGDYGQRRLEIDLYFDVGPQEPGLRIGDGEDFARAFGVDAEFFLNLETAWLRWKAVHE